MENQLNREKFSKSGEHSSRFISAVFLLLFFVKISLLFSELPDLDLNINFRDIRFT